MGRSRHMSGHRGWICVVSAILVVAAACSAGSEKKTAVDASGDATTRAPADARSATGPHRLTRSLLEIEHGARYGQSDWGYLVLDRRTGKVLASQAPNRMFDAGST